MIPSVSLVFHTTEDRYGLYLGIEIGGGMQLLEICHTDKVTM